MNEVRIDRHATFGGGIHSHVHLPTGDMIHGLELAWKGNLPNVSCFPEGVYALLPHISPNHGAVYAFVGGTVGLVPGQGKRWGCLIHPANYLSEIKGCLAVGLKASTQNGLPVVWSSQDAFGLLDEALKRAPAIAVVRWV